MKIKTRESLRTIKTFDRASSAFDKTKNGISSLTEQTQGSDYNSERDYAGSRIQSMEERCGKQTIYGANRLGRWGVRETSRNIRRWNDRYRKYKRMTKPISIAPPKRKALKEGMKTTPRITAKGSKRAMDASKRAVQVTAKLINRTIKNTKAALKAALMTGKAITAAIIAGGWIAVMIIIVICAVALIVGSAYRNCILLVI